jgi:hypothetical protein
LPEIVRGIGFSSIGKFQGSSQKMAFMTPDIALRCPNLGVSAWNFSQKQWVPSEAVVSVVEKIIGAAGRRECAQVIARQIDLWRRPIDLRTQIHVQVKTSQLALSQVNPASQKVNPRIMCMWS